jgi:CTP synthase (UTP-ammonia lyase)
MGTKYIIVTGGVVEPSERGDCGGDGSCSRNGFSVAVQKLDPYINVDQVR